MEQLLATKLYIPPTRPRLVSRPLLVKRINEGLHRKLTLISAPAGFGKTTLVSEWVDHLQSATAKDNQNEYKIAWLSLDDHDNDPIRFLSYFIASLQQAEEGAATLGEAALSMLRSAQPPPMETVLIALINDLAAMPKKIIIVLDDYHLISASAVDEALTFLLEHLPHQLHLIITTRVDPQVPLTRLRARSKLNELRAGDLRFSSTEAAEFLNQVMGLGLSTKEITALESRTEGWIAGLQLAAISIQGHEDTSTLIRSFTGSHRLVLDYLIEEVLEQQPENMQDFLLQTAILNRLSGPLCDALTGQEDGQATLEELERANLFIIPLDNERHWYRYHHLFADLLKQRLDLTHPNLTNDLHGKASAWYEANGNLSEAIHHAFAKDDHKTTTRLIEKGALGALERSDLRFIFRWVDQLPDTAINRSPWLFVYHCWALLISGQVDAAIPKLEDTDWLLNSVSDEDESKIQEMVGYIAGMKALLSSWKRDYQNGIKFANQAIANLPEDNWIRGYCAIVMGGAYWGNGDIQAAKEAFAESAVVGKNSGNIMLEVSGACNLAYTLELEGQLRQAKKLYDDTFQLTNQDGRVLPVAGYIHVEIGRVFYELNELDLASQHLLDGIKLCKHLADGRAERTGHYLLARVHLAKGDIAGAVNSIRDGDKADSSPETTFDLRGGEYLQIRLWLKENNLKNIEAWLKEHRANIKNVSHIKTLMTYSMQARALIVLGQGQNDGKYLEEANALLNKLLEVAENNGWWSKVIEMLALQALCLDAQGDTDKAFPKLERALSLAEPEGFIRTFVDEGTPMASLLYKFASLGISIEYTNRLLATFTGSDNERSSSEKTQLQKEGLIEPLSKREIEVLQLVAEGLTNKEIASRLFLTLNTIKSHTRSIFEKLDVNNRIQAATKAKALGILSRD